MQSPRQKTFSLSHKDYRYASQIDVERTPVIRYEEPSYIFDTLDRKKNYYHFDVDNLSRLVTLLDSIDYPVSILHFFEKEGPVGQYLELVEDNYDCRLHQIATIGSRHLKIESSVLFRKNTYLKLDHSIPHMLRTQNRLVSDLQLRFLNIHPDQLKSIRKFEQLQPKSWRHDYTKTIYKNNTSRYHFSHLQMNSLYRFGKTVLESGNHLSGTFASSLLIVRNTTTSRSRYIGNESDLIDRTGLTEIDFSELLVRQQIQAVNNCQVLVGLTGAGLANCVYMDPGACVVEVTPIGYSLPATNLFENICKVRGLRYERLFSTPLDENGSTVVNVGELCELLKGCLAMEKIS